MVLAALLAHDICPIAPLREPRILARTFRHFGCLMNISPARNCADPPAAPADWTIEVGCDLAGEGIYYFADVKRAGEVMSRIGLSGVTEEAEARRLLASKARAWIDEFLVREQHVARSKSTREG